jgi:hypothetical protein
MPAKNQRQDARRDENEPEIVKALESAGFLVERIGNPGDLLIWNHDSRHWVVLEVKVPGGRMTPKQQEYREDHPDVDIPIVETKEQAVIEVRMR